MGIWPLGATKIAASPRPRTTPSLPSNSIPLQNTAQMPLPCFTAAFNKTKAESFYLDSPDGQFASLADVTVVSAEGVDMMAHSQVLAQASSVLCALFASQEDESGICKVGTCCSTFPRLPPGMWLMRFVMFMSCSHCL